MNIQSKSKSPKITWQKIAFIALILAIAGYKWYVENKQPADAGNGEAVATNNSDGKYDANLPDNFDNGKSGGTATKDKASDLKFKPLKGGSSNNGSSSNGSSGEFLKSVGGNNLESPAGLIYGMGARGEHRVDHVMRHGKDDQSRPSHGVFDGDKQTILELLDEAYEMVKQNSKYVKSEKSRGNMAYTISMGRKVGYEGGQKGKRNGNRALKGVRLILDGKKVITAYPYR